MNVTGPVERFASVTPSRVRLSGPVGKPLAATVSIVPEKKYPFRITEVAAQNGQFIRWELLENNDSANPGYQLKIENLKPDTGRYFDTLRLKTDSAVRPEISLRVFGHIFDPKDSPASPDDPKTTSG